MASVSRGSIEGETRSRRCYFATLSMFILLEMAVPLRTGTPSVRSTFLYPGYVTCTLGQQLTLTLTRLTVTVTVTVPVPVLAGVSLMEIGDYDDLTTTC